MKKQPQIKTSVMWQFLMRVFKILQQLVVVAILARLLTPAEFGVAGQAVLALSFLTIFAELGLLPTLIQKKDLTTEDIAASYVIAFVNSLLVATVVNGGILIFSHFFGESVTFPLIHLITISLLINSFGVVPTSLLHRQLNYKAILVCDTVSYLIGYAFIAIVLSIYGYREYSLIYGVLASDAIRVCLLLKCANSKVCFTREPRNWMPVLRLSQGMGLLRMGFHLARNIDFFIVWNVFSVDAFGFYQRAYQLVGQPQQLIGGSINTTVFSAASRWQDEKESLRAICHKSLRTSMILMFPLYAFIFLLADEIVSILLGPQWTVTGAILKYLVLAGYPLCVHNSIESVIRSKGVTTERVLLCITYIALVFACCLIGAQWDFLDGVAIGLIIALFIQSVFALLVAKHLFGISMLCFSSDFCCAICIALGFLACSLPILTGLTGFGFPPIYNIITGMVLLVCFYVPSVMWFLKVPLSIGSYKKIFHMN